MNSGWGIAYKIALRWMPLDLTDDKSTSVQEMAWCRKATSHYLSQCWPRSMTPNGVTRPQWVNFLKTIPFLRCPANYLQMGHIRVCARQAGLWGRRLGRTEVSFRAGSCHPYITQLWASRIWTLGTIIACVTDARSRGGVGLWTVIPCNGESGCQERRGKLTKRLNEFLFHRNFHIIQHIIQERCNSRALAMELRLSCINPSRYTINLHCRR